MLAALRSGCWSRSRSAAAPARGCAGRPALAVGTALAIGVALVALLPPRGEIDRPQYYAHGARHPARAAGRRRRPALHARARRGARRAARRPRAAGHRARRARAARRRARALTIASDLHNNVLTLPILERSADGGPVLFPGDLTDRGSPLETRVVRRVVHDRQAVRVRLGQPRLRHARARARRRGRDRAHRGRPAERRRLPRRGRPARRRAARSRATPTRSSAARGELRRPLHSGARRPRCRTRSRAGCARCRTRST